MTWDGIDRREIPVAITKEDLKEVVDLAMERHVHSDSHAFVQALMTKEQRKQELWEKAKAHVLGWGLVSLIVFVFTMTWEHVVNLLTGK